MAGVGELLAGAIVGTLCLELFKCVVNLINKTNKFSPLLEAIKLTVGDLDSLIPKIQDLNEKLKISNKETDRLKKTLSDGIKLVGECSSEPKWYKKSKYTETLTALDEALERELNILTAHAASEMKEALLLARKHHDHLIELAGDGSKGLEMALLLARKHHDHLVELAMDGRKGLEMALLLSRKHHDHLVELARDGRKGLEKVRKLSDQLEQSARDGRAMLEMVRKNDNQLVELARDVREMLEMAKKHGNQLVELQGDWREMLEMAREHGNLQVESARDVREMLEGNQLVELPRDWRDMLEMARKHGNQLVELARDVREMLEMARKHGNQLVESERDGREMMEMARKRGNQLVEMARDVREMLEMARKHGNQLVESERDGREMMEMAKKRGNQLVESAWDGREMMEMERKRGNQLLGTRDAVREIKDLINEFVELWTLGMILIIVARGVSLLFSLPGERERTATAVAEGIILSRCEICKWGVSLVRSFVNRLALAALALHIFFSVVMVIAIIGLISEKRKRGNSLSYVPKVVCVIFFITAFSIAYEYCVRFIWKIWGIAFQS